MAQFRHVREVLAGSVMVVPEIAVVGVVAVVHHDKSSTRFDEPACQQAATTDLCTAVIVLNGRWFLSDIEGTANGCGCEQMQGAFQLPLAAGGRQAGFKVAPGLVQLLLEQAAAVEPSIAEPFQWQQVSRCEIFHGFRGGIG